MTRLPKIDSSVRSLSVLLMLLASPTGIVSLTEPLRGVGSAAESTAQADPNQIVDPTAYQDLRWRNVGPKRGGRVTAISGVRQMPCTFYMGSTGGGVWKTEDCGIVWRPLSDGQMSTGSIGAIAVAESNPEVVYVGTGSAAIRSNVIIGRGMYKSTDAGKTWQFLGLSHAGQIGSIAVHPADPDVAWVAALGSPYGPNAERGVFKTTDGGRSWRKTLFVNEETGGRVVAVDASEPNVLYAGMYRAFRKGWDIISGGPATEGGIYKSTDGGESWTKLSTGLPQSLIGKIDLDIARSNHRVIYAMVEAPAAEGGLYRSNDAGATWVLVNNSQRLRARPFYFHYVDVNPKSEDEVWVSELALHKSTDGGKTFTQVEVPHGDNHGLWFNPDNPHIMTQCSDGGAAVTQNGGLSWSSILNQPTAELYMVAVDEQFPYRLYAPQQDNSTIVVPSVPPVSWGLDSPEQLWSQASGCETGQIQPRPDGKVIYGVCKGEFGRYSIETGQEKHFWVYPQNRYGHMPSEIRYRFPRQSVVSVSPHDPRIVYHASHVLHRTTDEGATWETISPDLTAAEPGKQIVPGNPITRDVTGEEVYSSIYALAESRLERGVLWVGANDGPVHVSRNNGRTWTNVTPKDLPPGGRVQNIEDSPHRKGSAYIAVYRYLREHDLKPYIYLTNDYGRTWTRLTDGRNGIPEDYPTRVVREDKDVPGLLYAGTEFGAFVSFDNGKHWQSLQLNLPATPVTDIRVHRRDLVISTMGRSFWILDDVSPLQQLAIIGKQIKAAAVHLFVPRQAYRMRYQPSGGRPDRPEYPPVGARIDYHLPSVPDGDATLEIIDASGTVLRSYGTATEAERRRGGQDMRTGRRSADVQRLTKKAGHNRFTWDLRTEGPWDSTAAEGRPGGPMVAPGKYLLRLTAGEAVETRTLEVLLDPRVAADGVTQADLAELYDISTRVRNAISEGRRLRERLSAAMQRAGVRPPEPPGPGQWVSAMRYDHPLQSLWARLVTAQGVYQQPMLLDQLQNVARMLGRAEQKPGKDAWDRYNDLAKQLSDLKAEVDRIAPM